MMIKITKEQDAAIKSWVDYYDGARYVFINNHANLSRYTVDKNICLNDITVSELEKILYTPNSFEIIETESEKKERWNAQIKYLDGSSGRHTSDQVIDFLYRFAKDFNIKL